MAQSPSRRTFLKAGAAAAAVNFTLQSALHAAGSDVLKVGLVGCGGRGTGAAGDCLAGDPNTKLVAMADTFQDRLDQSLAALKGTSLASQVDVKTENQFVGWDAHKQLIESDVDVVLLCTPPHFRPAHLKAAVDAGKHIFCEKPVAVDGPGVRSVFQTVEEAKQKNLTLVSGLCWRYDYGMRATFEQVLSGTCGEILAIQATYNTGTLKQFPRQTGWSDMEWQLRNWQHFTWLSGDFNVEQHVHSLDKVLWAMGDEAPVKCVGTGGRQARTGPESGHIYDHFNVVYEFANGVKAFCNCRQQDGTDGDVSDHVFGTKGIADIFKHRINPARKGGAIWAFRGDKGNMYRTEHKEMLAAIRAGTPINNGEYMTKSTLTAIMGRMSAYTGKEITWEQALNSKENLSPARYDWMEVPMPQVAIPGITQFA